MDSSDQFLEVLSDSTLLTPEQWESAVQHGQAHRDPYQLANVLVAEELLTRWQAKKLLSGKRQFVVGKYKLMDVLGRGGMGTVYRAQQMGLCREVALKVMAPRNLKNPVGVPRFLSEIRLLAELDHPNIVRAFDADSENQHYFLVMEYVPGESLAHWLQKPGRFFFGWACECVRQAALGLEHAAERHLIHRDVKPSNLIITSNPDKQRVLVKLLDFGLAFALGEAEDHGLTVAGRTVGTIDYMAPEQSASSRDVDARTDIYSLGCVFYHMLTDHLPFEGGPPLERLKKRQQELPPPVSRYRHDLPDEIDGILRTMLAPDRDRRFQSPLEVAEALEPYCYVADPEHPKGPPPARRRPTSP